MGKIYHLESVELEKSPEARYSLCDIINVSREDLSEYIGKPDFRLGDYVRSDDFERDRSYLKINEIEEDTSITDDKIIITIPTKKD